MVPILFSREVVGVVCVSLSFFFFLNKLSMISSKGVEKESVPNNIFGQLERTIEGLNVCIINNNRNLRHYSTGVMRLLYLSLY